jgi:hypothetical protein
MFILKKNNVERVASNEAARDAYISKGFDLVEAPSKEETELDSKKNETLDKTKALEDMTIEELKEYAVKNGIDIGKASTQNGILEKIKAAEVK